MIYECTVTLLRDVLFEPGFPWTFVLADHLPVLNACLVVVSTNGIPFARGGHVLVHDCEVWIPGTFSVFPFSC